MTIKFYKGQVGLTWHMKLIASGEGNTAFGETEYENQKTWHLK